MTMLRGEAVSLRRDPLSLGLGLRLSLRLGLRGESMTPLRDEVVSP